MSTEVSAAPRVMPVLKSTSDLPRKEEKVDANSLHAYQMWLKEKQMREQEEEDKKMKTEDEDEDSNEENFRVDAVLERGPSPPESETSNTYEWSYEEQFKQVSLDAYFYKNVCPLMSYAARICFCLNNIDSINISQRAFLAYFVVVG